MKACLAFFVLLALPTFAEDSALAKLSTAATDFFGQLDEKQAKAARHPFASEERESWNYVPTTRQGVSLKSLNEAQAKQLQTLLAASLSAQGQAAVRDVIRLEGLLYEKADRASFRDPGAYTATLFGKPAADESWGWRFEGHHVSLNFTVASDQVVLTTPFFFGANPAEVRDVGEMKGMRLLGKIEDAARDLAGEIHGEGLHVRYTMDPPAEILSRNDRSAKALAKEGVTTSELTAQHRADLLALVRAIAAYQNPEFLSITEQDLAKAQFAWAGEFEKGEQHYFRIQTPEVLIEYANTQNGGNHAHLVWRNFANDFGRDPLKEHLKHGHSSR